MYDVVILAGSGKETELTVAEKVTNKAFITIGGRPMLAYVLDALKKTGKVDRIAVVGPVAELLPFIEEYGIVAVAQGDSIPENLSKGVDALRPRQHFLIVSADIPFLTPQAVLGFLEACKPYDFDFYYPIVSKEDNNKRFPGVERTYVTLRDGVFTGGNLFLANPGGVEVALPRLDRFFALRKSPLKLAATLGVGFLLKLLTKRLTISQLEKRFSSLFGLNGKAVLSPYAEIGTDVDKLTDLELARKEIK
jgi:GTP:adenosylcobinamide-phosphate guanylyltransferase